MSATMASQRYETELAPTSLLLTQELTNSVPFETYVSDLLSDAGTAQQWLGEGVTAWCGAHGQPPPDLEVAEPGLRRLRSLRADLRRMAAQEPDALSLTAPVTVTVTAGGAAL